MNELTIVIVNYNSKAFLEQCVRSIVARTQGISFEIVVVDNASRDRNFDLLKSQFPRTLVILNQENRGFAVACNQGIRAKPAPFYLLLNPDCVVGEEAITRTLGFLKSHKEAGIVGCRVLNQDGSLQRACRRSIPTPSVALSHFLGLDRLFARSSRRETYHLTSRDSYQTYQVGAVSGSFLFLRQQLLDEIGGLDERYFLYGEDLDFCYRATLAGWKVYFFGGAEVTHYKRRSSSSDASGATFHFYNAMKLFYRKHFAAKRRVSSWLVLGAINSLYCLDRLRQALGLSQGPGSSR